ncbi:MAG TPA: helical backbone metal receptor [Puia sp.]|nr:helical backbone metal receptor [Puia sp.]
MRAFTDQMGRTVICAQPPRRIVSLVPSQTELLYDLGLDDSVSGITKFCVHPESWFIHKPKVGGTRSLHLSAIRSLQPDLVIANKEENKKEEIDALASEYPVWISDIKSLEDALQMIRIIGDITAKNETAAPLVEKIRNKFTELSNNLGNIEHPSTAYLIWQNPYMAAGGDTFIHDMMKRSGLSNLFAHANRYPEITVSQLKEMGCELLLLSSEPYPFSAKHLPALKEALPDTRIMLVDGEFFSWYGSRLTLAPAYFRELLQQIRQ